MKKKILFIILFILIIFFVGTVSFVYFKKKELKVTDEASVNEVGEQVVDLVTKYEEYEDISNDVMKKEQIFKELVFSGVQLKENDEQVVFIVTITNNSSEDISLGKFKVVFKDKDNNVVETIVGYAGDVIKSGSEVTPYVSANIKIDNVYTLEYQEIVE